MKRLQLEMNKNVNIQRNTFQLFLSYAGRTRKVATAHNQSKRFLFTSAGLSQGMPVTIETRRLSFFMHKKNRTRQVKCALGIKHRHSQVRAVNNDKIRLLSQLLAHLTVLIRSVIACVNARIYEKRRDILKSHNSLI